MPTIAAIYARVSTEEQANRDFSIPAQIRAVREYCTKNDIKIYEEYIDEAISGQEENRPAFQKMLKDAQSKRFSIIFVHKFDRFARKRELSIRVKGQLKKSNVNVISVTEPIEDSPMGFFVEGLHELLAEYYIKNLSKEVMKGMNERALTGKHMGQMPYGYIIKDGQVYLNEDQAPIVKKIFELYNSGWGHFKISRWLNENKIPTYKGFIGSWMTFQVKQILKNCKYIGINKWNGQKYDGQFPKIIEHDDFCKAQLQLDKRGKEYTYKGNNYNKFLLLGLLFCKNCNASFRVKLNNAHRKGEYYAYQCHNAALYRKGCTFAKLFKAETLEKEIENTIENIIKDKKINIEIDRVKPIDATDILEERLKNINKELSRAKEAYLAGVFTLEELKKAKLSLDTEKERLELDENQILHYNKEEKTLEFIGKISTLWELYKSAKTIPDKKKILTMFIKSIAVSSDGIDIRFYC